MNANSRPQHSAGSRQPVVSPLERPGVLPLFNSTISPTTPIYDLPMNVNAASSIDELLHAYGLQRGVQQSRTAPPAARPIFPENYRTQRVHLRHRPGSSPAISRPPSRRAHSGNISRSDVASLHSAMASISTIRSDASSDILGLTPLYEETGEMPSPFLRRPRMAYRSGTERRPDTANSNVPRMRMRAAAVEVVSCATQTRDRKSV